jgi:hypothetical protein
MNARRQAQLQEALEAEAKIIREGLNDVDEPTSNENFDEWSDSLFEALTDSPEVMACLVRELFELVTGQEAED